jgi:VWFA-related protein
MPKTRAKSALLLGAVLLMFAFSSELTAGDKNKDKNPQTASPAAAPQSQEAEGDDFKIAVDASMVTTDVTVLGKIQDHFQPEDFIVYDEGVSQEASYFARNKRPLAVAILIDASSSTEPYLPMLQISAISALKQLDLNADVVTVYKFNAKATRLLDFTNDIYLASETIGNIKCEVFTNIWDSLYEASHYLKKHAPDKRRAIILVSDDHHAVKTMGMSTPHVNEAKDALFAMLEDDVILYNIKTPGERSIDIDDSIAISSVYHLAEETGGQVLEASSISSVQSVFNDAINKLRDMYTIGFNPSSKGEGEKFHKLSVKFSKEDRCPKCKILTRSGYYSGRSPSIPKIKTKEEPPILQTGMSNQKMVQRNIVLIGNHSVEFRDIPFQVKLTELTGNDGKPSMKLDLAIDGKAVTFHPVQDRQACKLRVTVILENIKGKHLNSDWRLLEGMLKEETYKETLRSGIPYSITTPLKEDSRVMKVIVYDENSDKFGMKIMAIQQ